jgi:hypothetical protein
VSGSTAPGADLQETEARSGRPLPIPTVSRHGCFFHKTYHANGLCTLLQTRIAVRRGKEKRSLSPSPHRTAHIRLWPVCSFEGKKRQSVAERAQIDKPKAAGGTRILHNACLQRTGDSRIASRSVHSLLAPGHVLADYTGPKVSCGSCCVVLYWYTSCSSSNLPSSEYAGQDCSVKSGRPSSVGMCDPNSKGFSLIDPNQPRCAEFFRGGETPEPLHPDHIRVKRPVCPQVFF